MPSFLRSSTAWRCSIKAGFRICLYLIMVVLPTQDTFTITIEQ